MGTTTKLDFPQFDGSGDALPWLDHWEHFFWHQLMPNDAKVSLATFHLEAEAQFWFVKHNLLWVWYRKLVGYASLMQDPLKS